MIQTEQRKTKRFELRLPIELVRTGAERLERYSETRNISSGGVLFTYSCSGGISADLFHKIVASAGADAGVDGYIAERLGAAPDHPMTLAFPEGEYLKGLIVVRK